MKSNEDLQQEVEDALKWEPLLEAAEIGVRVKNGIVTLSGTVDNYRKKMQAETAASHVPEVVAVVEEIKVAHPKSISDYDIAAHAVAAIKDNWNIPAEIISMKVENGYIYLSGFVPFQYQKEAAKRTVGSIDGVKDVINLIHVENQTDSPIDRQEVIDALLKHFSINANNIQVEVTGNTVILKGFVPSVEQKEEAAKVAWLCAGVIQVKNHLNINAD